MKILIVEDEKIAADHLEAMLKNMAVELEVLAKLDSIKTTVSWLKEQHVDLIFMDIQLADGLSFSIFEQCEVTCPVIFTTAYDNYALQAFKVNSIDYLLKPIDQDDLVNAWQKFEQLHGTQLENKALLELTRQMIKKEYKQRYMVKKGNHIRSLPVAEIAFFHSVEKSCFAESYAGEEYLIDYTLDQIELFCDPRHFFRINRKYIIAIDAIQDIIPYSGHRLNIKLKACKDPDILVSRERVKHFKNWLG